MCGTITMRMLTPCPLSPFPSSSLPHPLLLCPLLYHGFCTPFYVHNQPRVYVLCTANDPGPPHVPPSPHRPFRRMARLLSRPLCPSARCKTIPLWKLHRYLRRQHGHGHGVRPPHPLGPRAPPCYGERATHRTQSLNTSLEHSL